jgi:hypothetical protein
VTALGFHNWGIMFRFLCRGKTLSLPRPGAHPPFLCSVYQGPPPRYGARSCTLQILYLGYFMKPWLTWMYRVGCWTEWWTVNWGRSWRNRSWFNQDILQEFAWRDQKRHTYISIRGVGVLTDVRTGPFDYESARALVSILLGPYKWRGGGRGIWGDTFLRNVDRTYQIARCHVPKYHDIKLYIYI